MSKVTMLFCLAMLGSSCMTTEKAADGTSVYKGSWDFSGDVRRMEKNSAKYRLLGQAVRKGLPVSDFEDEDGNRQLIIGEWNGFGIPFANSPRFGEYPDMEASALRSLKRSEEGAMRNQPIPLASPIAGSGVDVGLHTKVDKLGTEIGAVKAETKKNSGRIESLMKGAVAPAQKQ